MLPSNFVLAQKTQIVPVIGAELRYVPRGLPESERGQVLASCELRLLEVQAQNDCYMLTLEGIVEAAGERAERLLYRALYVLKRKWHGDRGRQTTFFR